MNQMRTWISRLSTIAQQNPSMHSMLRTARSRLWWWCACMNSKFCSALFFRISQKWRDEGDGSFAYSKRKSGLLVRCVVDSGTICYYNSVCFICLVFMTWKHCTYGQQECVSLILPLEKSKWFSLIEKCLLPLHRGIFQQGSIETNFHLRVKNKKDNCESHCGV